jgi:hypothetical protein
MEVDERLEKLSSQLSRQTLGPFDAAVREVTARVGTASSALVAALRWAAHERPLMTLLLSCQLGYLVGRMGHR